MVQRKEVNIFFRDWILKLFCSVGLGLCPAWTAYHITLTVSRNLDFELFCDFVKNVTSGNDTTRETLPVCLPFFLDCLFFWLHGPRLRPELDVCYRRLLLTGLWLHPGLYAHFVLSCNCLYISALLLFVHCKEKYHIQPGVNTFKSKQTRDKLDLFTVQRLSFSSRPNFIYVHTDWNDEWKMCLKYWCLLHLHC